MPNDRSRSGSSRRPSPAWNEAAWVRATEHELLIDLAEWADAAGRARPTSYRCAVTSALWTLLEMGITKDSVGLELRIRSLVRSADRILLPLVSEKLSPPGVVADFAVQLPSRSGASGHPLRLHAERSTGAALFVSIGLRSDFSVHPLERSASEPSCDSLRGERTHRSGSSSPSRPEQAQNARARSQERTGSALLGVRFLAAIVERALRL